MTNNRMPVVFVGHGSPMLALDNNQITKEIAEVGHKIVENFGKPKGILAISAHWYKGETYIQDTEEPRQIYDMYGFPKELYEVKYPVKGNLELSKRVQELLGDRVSVDNSWGIDHGTWTVLTHMFPNADIPVVQLSVNSKLSTEAIFSIGKSLIPLRNEGYLIVASGNIVHNLRLIEWDNLDGTPMAYEFNNYIVDALKRHDDDLVIHYKKHDNYRYSIPTKDHYLPLIYALGAADGDKVEVFNNTCNLGTMAMTGFIFNER